jgi:predicted permease
MRRTPVFCATVILSLALGIGANAAVFSVADRLFLRPPPGLRRSADLRTLRIVHAQIEESGSASSAFERDAFVLMRDQLVGTASIAGYSYACFACGDPLTRVRAVHATANFLPLVTSPPALGRYFDAREEAAEAAVAVISYDFWTRAFGRNMAIIGRSVEVEKATYAIVGVAPDGFRGVAVDATDAWLPITAGARVAVIARLGRNVDDRQLDAVTTVAYRHARLVTSDSNSMPSIVSGSINPGRHPGKLSPLDATIARTAVVAVIVLLIAVANVATLLLVRAARRRREMAIRLSLGISRAQLLLQLLAEGVTLAVAGAVVAAFVGLWGGNALRATLFPLARAEEFGFDGRIVVFTGGAALTAGLLASLAPAIWASRSDLAQLLHGSGGQRATRGSRLWAAFVTIQSTLSIVLLVGAGLFLQSLRNAHQVNLGYDVERLAFVTLRFGPSTEVPASFRSTMEQELRRVASIPGVEGATLSSMPPMGGLLFELAFLPSGDTIDVDGSRPTWSAVSPSFFSTTGMRIVAGRPFRDTDVNGAEGVVVVNETMARAVWPARNPIGQCVKLGEPGAPCTTVAGVVADAHVVDVIESAQLHNYKPLAQAFITAAGSHRVLAPRTLALTLRASPERRPSLIQLVRHDLQTSVSPLAEIRAGDVSQSIAPQYHQWRQAAVMFTSMGALALLLTAIGVYGVNAYVVAQRMHEMGVRIALGAKRRDIAFLVLRAGIRTAIPGMGVGVIAALALGRIVRATLYDISPNDPGVLIAASVLLLAVALIACLDPARRAMGVDPAEAFRTE